MQVQADQIQHARPEGQPQPQPKRQKAVEGQQAVLVIAALAQARLPQPQDFVPLTTDLNCLKVSAELMEEILIQQVMFPPPPSSAVELFWKDRLRDQNQNHKQEEQALFLQIQQWKQAIQQAQYQKLIRENQQNGPDLRLHERISNPKSKVPQSLNGFDLFETDERGDTPLHVAVKNNKLKWMKPLIEAKCNLNAQNLEGDTPLHCASRVHASAVKTRMVNMLIRAGADQTVRNFRGELYNHEPIHLENLDVIDAELEQQEGGK